MHPQEGKSLGKGGEAGFLRLVCQQQVLQDCLHVGVCQAGFGFAFHQDDEVVGVAHQVIAQPGGGEIQPVEEDVCQQGRKRGAHGNAAAGGGTAAAFLQPLADERQEGVVRQVRLQKPLQQLVIDGVEEGVNVGIQHVQAVVGAVDEDALDCLLEAAPGAVAVGAIKEAGFIEGHQHIRHGALQHPVGDGGDAQGAELAGFALGDVAQPQLVRLLGVAADGFCQLHQAFLPVAPPALDGDGIDAGDAVIFGDGHPGAAEDIGLERLLQKVDPGEPLAGGQGVTFPGAGGFAPFPGWCGSRCRNKRQR